ncbi:Uncharacterized conserved protein YlxW, UPF0749 family [Mesobacillus persicus]|uniref:Uncharacterized conserved protein YlxW, UPF0749 family n=1 Tax=Mesobacillus persicus TaxID=930146 RepID=A0A1H8FBT6_9BACI|nr:DUF881 domain-containing protein [Mesobacillus persicus]SEN28924.1 Uncharacterized conserved protein YlxW, UPF0749 family [Mesobacillus persicus]
MKKKLKTKRVVLSIVCLILGFMIAYSYRLTESGKSSRQITDSQWEKNLSLRNELNEQREKNRDLQEELNKRQEMVRDFETQLANEAQVYFNLAEDAEKYRMFLGKVKVKGAGVKVTLADGEYNPDEPNINNYLVHEHHVYKVINELYISGASAIAINGQRLSHNSYILCDGPVITVDGYQHPAPFEITAIGEPKVLSAALNITGGIKDQLVNDQIIFSLQEQSDITLDPVVGKK